MNINAFVMKLGILLWSLLIFAGCGTNNSQSLPTTAPINPDENATTAVASLSIRNGSSVTVSHSQESVTIEVRALTKSNMLAPSGTVLATYLEANSTVDGDLAATSATIDNGVATFVYTAPKDLQNQIDAGNTGTSFRFYSAEDTSISTAVSIVFDTKADTGGSDPISAIVLSSYVVSVDEPKETVTIEVTAKNSDGSYVANAKVGLKQLTQTGAVDVGTTDSEVAIVNGKGSFTYTAPLNINNATAVSPVQFQVCDKVNTDVCQVFNVTIASATTATPRLTVSPSSKTLTQNAEAVTVTVLATDSAGLALQSGKIEVLNPVGASVGYFTETERDIVNGVSTFSYVGPNPLYSGYASFTFRFKENPTYKATWNVTFAPTAGVTPDEIRALATDGNVTVNTAGETKTIKVTAFTNGNALAQTGTVSVVYPSASGSIGTFSPAQAEVDNGVATFTYTAPTPLVNAPDQIFTFKADSGVTTKLKVSYVPQASSTNPVAQTLVILNGNDVNITKNGEVVNLRIRVYGVDNNPFNGGNVKIQFPDVAVTGTDVGSFSALSVPCVNGVADFTYNAPNNITGRSDTFSFIFYHDSEASPAQETWNVRMDPDDDIIVVTTYKIDLIASDGNLTMGLEDAKQFSVSVTDEEGKEISEGNFTIKNLNAEIADLIYTNGTVADTLTLNQVKNPGFQIKTYKKSGLMPLEITVTFTDVNQKIQTLKRVYSIVIFSGPPTAINIAYASTGLLEGYESKFVEYLDVFVTDQYNNPVNTEPYLSMGAIAGYATTDLADEYDPSNYLFYVPNGATTGTITMGTPSTFTAGSNVFMNVDRSGNDKLVVFGKDYTFNASGKWDFEYSSDSVLDLLDDYNGSTQNNLGFAVGHNYRPDTCNPGNRALATVTSGDGMFKLDERGLAKLEMIYDHYLVGKSIVVWVNVIGLKLSEDKELRIGSALKHTMRGRGLEADGSYSAPPSFTGTVRFYIGLTDSTEWYRNARFSYKVEASAGVTITGIAPSYSYGVDDCTQSEGVAFVDVSFTTNANGGTIGVVDTVVASEF